MANFEVSLRNGNHRTKAAERSTCLMAPVADPMMANDSPGGCILRYMGP